MFREVQQICSAGFYFLLSLICLCSAAHADVGVYAEGAYTDTNLVVYIYADISGSTELRSAGVKLTYSSAELSIASAEKNEADWFLGTQAYMDPQISTPGQVVIILGKIDTADLSAGVSGERVLLGKVIFNRTGSSTDFGLGLDYGKRGVGGSYKNFVDTANPATVLDDVAVGFGSLTVVERGDANADGSIDISDVSEIRKMVFNEIPKTCYADCNADGDVNISDVTCIRDKVFQ
ncbi:MAG: hypothetical protein HKP58_03065 [Desulfatitalea sp.]|nr:dockerin type I repeat-containing protein [Desulfatitalea sp.]NNJ99372.1 hypothetical protein [Desulfatitalea sp.]